MESVETRTFSSLVESVLGVRLPGRLADNISFADLSTEAKGVVLRMLALMKRASCPATELTPHMIWLLCAVTPGMLPSAWGGRIPPVTSPGRHAKLDTYVARQTWPSSDGQPVFVDLGCGFPPLTSVDTAKNLSGWFVFGVDRSFASYVLYDAEGHYACFDRDGIFLYFQPQMKPLHDSPAAIQNRLQSLFANLSHQMQVNDDHAGATIEKEGNRLIHNPVRKYEAQNLTFIESDIDGLRLPPARVIRCMNVLLYFQKSVRQRMRISMGAFLEDGGLLISGFNHPLGIYARYAVYKKEGTGIRPCEFAFSPDNLRPLGIGPWLTLQDADEEAELLADLTGAIRADRGFWTAFDRYVDQLRTEHGICRRGDDGFQHFAKGALTALPDAIVENTAAIWQQLEAEGFTDGAVEALNRAGYKAWKNAVGDIAVRSEEVV